MLDICRANSTDLHVATADSQGNIYTGEVTTGEADSEICSGQVIRRVLERSERTRESKTLTRKLLVGFCSAVVALLFAGPMLAHHGATAYDASQNTTLKGTVVDFEFINPHCQLFVNVTDGSGNAVKMGRRIHQSRALSHRGVAGPRKCSSPAIEIHHDWESCQERRQRHPRPETFRNGRRQGDYCAWRRR